MKWKLAAVISACTLQAYSPPPADACGVKLTIKSSAPRKAPRVKHSSNPSNVLLLGTPPRRLERDLAAAGHKVDIARTPEQARHDKQYAVVITDPAMQAQARANFKDSKIIVRSGDVVADVRTVESNVGRSAVATRGDRIAVRTRDERVPKAVGPVRTPDRTVVAAGTAGTPPRTDPAPTPPRPAEVRPTPPRPEPPPQPAPKPEPAITDTNPKPVDETPPKPTKPAVARAFSGGEIYFSINSAASSRTRALARAVTWLNANPGASATLEGYADPSGNPDANMALSQRRAEWVRDYLVSQGIDASRLEVTAFGDTKLKYGRTDPRNRRVAIVPNAAP